MLHQQFSELRRCWPSCFWLVSELETIEARSDINHWFDLHLLLLKQWALFRVCLSYTDTFQFARSGKHSPDIVRRRWTSRQMSKEKWKETFHLAFDLISLPEQKTNESSNQPRLVLIIIMFLFFGEENGNVPMISVFVFVLDRLRFHYHSFRRCTPGLVLFCLTIELYIDINVRMLKLKNESARRSLPSAQSMHAR